MSAVRWLFLAPAALLPASFVGLALYYLVAAPTKDDFFVGPVGAATGVLLLLDALLGVVGLAAFLYYLWAAPTKRRQLWLIAGLSVLATAATYGLAMQILRFGYPLHT